MRQEAGDKLRVTIISPGFVQTNFAESVNNPEVKAEIATSMDGFAIPPVAAVIPSGRNRAFSRRAIASMIAV